MKCSRCQFFCPDFTTPCGHLIHRECLKKSGFVCYKCGKYITTFQLFWGILRRAGMNESEYFYERISRDSFEGLILWTVENKVSQCDAIWDHVHHFNLEMDESTFIKLALKVTLWRQENRLDSDPKLMAFAIKKSFFKAVKGLHKAGDAFLTCNGRSCLSLASEHGSLEIVNYIIACGSNFKIGELDFIFHAINRNNLDILKSLLRAGVQPVHSELIFACLKGNLEMVQLLIKNYPNPNVGDPIKKNQEYSELIHSFDFESIPETKFNEVIGYFIYLGADIDARNEFDETVLYKLCCCDENFKLIEHFIKFGADINVVAGPKRISAYNNACRNGCTNIVRMLLRNGVNMRDCDEFGLNGYLNAIRSGNLETVKITMGLCDKNFVDKNGRGPFYHICKIDSEKEAIKIFKYLTKEGVNMNILDDQGKHPLMDPEIIGKNYKLLIAKYFENEVNLDFWLDFGSDECLNSLFIYIPAESLWKRLKGAWKMIMNRQ